MTDDQNDANVLSHARELIRVARIDKNEEYERAIIDMVSFHFGLEYDSARDYIGDVNSENEHVILVAFTVMGDTMESAQKSLMKDLCVFPETKDSDIESWWIAMDERYDGSDCDSAEFVSDSGHDAWLRFINWRTSQEIEPPITIEDGVMAQTRDFRKTALNHIQGFSFPSLRQGREFIKGMNHKIEHHGIATINDAAMLLNILPSFPGDKMGWLTPLPYECIRRQGEHDFMLDLPTPTHKTR